MEKSNYILDTLYLAGYAVECSLKSLILDRTAKSKWPDVCHEIGSGAIAHNPDYLGHILNRSRCRLPTQVAESLSIIKGEWTTSLRYSGLMIPRPHTERFMKHVEWVYAWVERSL